MALEQSELFPCFQLVPFLSLVVPLFSNVFSFSLGFTTVYKCYWCFFRCVTSVFTMLFLSFPFFFFCSFFFHPLFRSFLFPPSCFHFSHFFLLFKHCQRSPTFSICLLFSMYSLFPFFFVLPCHPFHDLFFVSCFPCLILFVLLYFVFHFLHCFLLPQFFSSPFSLIPSPSRPSPSPHLPLSLYFLLSLSLSLTLFPHPFPLCFSASSISWVSFSLSLSLVLPESHPSEQGEELDPAEFLARHGQPHHKVVRAPRRGGESLHAVAVPLCHCRSQRDL